MITHAASRKQYTVLLDRPERAALFVRTANGRIPQNSRGKVRKERAKNAFGRVLVNPAAHATEFDTGHENRLT